MRDSNFIKKIFSDKRKNFDSFYSTEKEVISKVFSLKKSSIDYDLNVPDALKVLLKNK